MDIEEFKRSVIPKEIRVEDTDRLEKGMIILTAANPGQQLMIIDVLDEMALGVIEVDEVLH